MNARSRIVTLLPVVLCAFACSSSEARALLRDGLFLSYDLSGSAITVTFRELGKNRFEAVVSPGGMRETVNGSLKASGGRIFEVAALGPLWIPPREVRPGGRAHGDRVEAVRSWNGWEIGVVKASFGIGGALRGEWYYEKQTGFLVGGVKSTIVSEEGEGTRFVLVSTNIEELRGAASEERF